MLSRREIERISKSLTLGNTGHAEKLYLQDIILSTISRETSDQLAFKGGTALLKFYQLDRFSEDLDFTAREKVDLQDLVANAVRDLDRFNAHVEEREDDENPRSFGTRLGIQGPLYTGERRSLCFIRIEVNKKSSASRVRNLRYTPEFTDITSFELTVLSEEEILAEKIRALMTRNQPRDLYDIYHLLSKGVELHPDLVQEKLAYYDLQLSPGTVAEKAEELEGSWETVDTLTYSTPPDFRTALGKLEQALEDLENSD